MLRFNQKRGEDGEDDGQAEIIEEIGQKNREQRAFFLFGI
jgi:hypothetical protein